MLTQTPTRPLVRYLGGKWKLAPWIVSHMPHHRVYVEPFGGGGSVLLRKPRAFIDTYNDIDGEMVNLFTVARDRGPELVRAVELTLFSREEYAKAYEPTDDPLERARRAIVKCHMGIGTDSLYKRSGFRSSMNGRPNTHQSTDWRNYPEALRLTIERLRGVVIESVDGIDLIVRTDRPSTLFYCDPTYDPETRGSARYRFEMSEEKHRVLAERLGCIQGMAMVSGYRSRLYDELYRDWVRIDKETHADGARPRTESLWLSPNCKKAGLI